MSEELNYQGLTPFEASYFETALWSSTDSFGASLDNAEYSDAELTEEAKKRIQDDCAKFENESAKILNAEDYCTGDFPVAHDFWLTRNRHGAGFWDGDYPEPLGKQLTDLAHNFGECDIYIDDGKIYIA